MIVYKIICCICFFYCSVIAKNSSDLKFPDDFSFGASSAAYQIEGAWNLDGRSPSIWDTFAHDHPELITDGSNGDVGPDSYHFYEDDINAIKSMGLEYYRFSISWTRILPRGDTTYINELGISYYNALIDKLLENGIKPMVTMQHYDFPDVFQKQFGGLTNEIFVNYFEAYANVLFDRFGDRVKMWITFNEPFIFCHAGYSTAKKAPHVIGHGLSDYLCGHNVLKSHAAAYHLYKNRYQAKQKGRVGITLNSPFYYSPTNDTKTVERGMHYRVGMFANPIFSSKGGYPEFVVREIKENSLKEGLGWSRLPELTPEWQEKIKGSADFLGLNYYTSRLIESVEDPEAPHPSWERDTGSKLSILPEWKQGGSSWLYSVPNGLVDLLRWIKKEYNNPEVIITEIGWSDKGELEDVDRIDFLKSHLTGVLHCILNDECNLKGFIVWSIIDNYEWEEGYTEKFGMFAVNLTSPRKERTPKLSSKFMKQVAQTRSIP